MSGGGSCLYQRRTLPCRGHRSYLRSVQDATRTAPVLAFWSGALDFPLSTLYTYLIITPSSHPPPTHPPPSPPSLCNRISKKPTKKSHGTPDPPKPSKPDLLIAAAEHVGTA